jgi:hypothetical protein
MPADAPKNEYGPWFPGLSSELPREFLPLSTMFRAGNVSTSPTEARELSDICGLAPHELVAFRAERLIVHELLVRVTADLTVPDGPNYEDLGISFRDIAGSILSRHIAPHYPEINKLHDDLNSDASVWIEGELSTQLFLHPEAAKSNPGRKKPFQLFGFGALRPDQAKPELSLEDNVFRALETWSGKSNDVTTPLEEACIDALIKTVEAVMRKRGHLIRDLSLITWLATTMVCNVHGSERIGDAIDPYIRQAAAGEDYRLLPRQDRPVVMNVKGASASGKSTMRPLQRKLAERLDIPWRDFALISPDIWRKFLLDYDSLGDAYKYAGAMAAHEVEIIDRKLDRYMADKAAAGNMSHLLIDRFRFDSFVPETEGDDASKLLTRFGDLVYMYFMITPPEATVERAWKRGQEFGRYKPVDDLLDHNVEAYTGMPHLFFTWALRTKKRVHYEFLDNSVPQGQRPRTVAFGWNGEMNILDIKSMLDIDRFKKININAAGPEQVYDDAKMTPENNVEFLRQCARMIPVINFLDHRTGNPYARLEQGAWTWRDEAHLAGLLVDPDARAGLRAMGLKDRDPKIVGTKEPPLLDHDKTHTLGAWGGAKE